MAAGPGGYPMPGDSQTGGAANEHDTQGVTWRTHLDFFVNGRRVQVADAQPEQTLLTYLREGLGLTGTKLGCGEGGCGACTVTVAHYDKQKQEVSHRAVHACLVPLCSVDGCSVTTVEGIGTAKAPHAVQQRLAEMNGSQCGYCTPGIVMSLYSTLCKNDKPTLADIEASFDGNLCRCTGYRPILDAAKTFVCDKHSCPATPDLEHAGAQSAVKVCHSTKTMLDSFTDNSDQAVCLAHFPDALRNSVCEEAVKIVGKRVVWYRPSDLPSLLALKAARPDAKIVAGNTEVGIETKFKRMAYPVMISTSAVPELQELRFDEDGALIIGGAVTLSAIEYFIEDALKERKPSTAQGLQAMLDMLRWFASSHIRNVAVLAGNIVTASPISDMNPILMALGATLTLSSTGGNTREVPVRDFFKKYRVVDMQPTEVLSSVRVPAQKHEFEFVKCFKQAKRRDDDISIVNACFCIQLSPGSSGWTVSKINTGFGGMAPKSVPAPVLEAKLEGATWGEASMETAYEALAEDFQLPESVPGGMAAFRQTLVASFLCKFYVSVSLELAQRVAGLSGLPSVPCVAAADASAAQTFVAVDRPITFGAYGYHVPKGGLQHSAAAGGEDHDLVVAKNGESAALDRSPVGEPLQHRSALLQCTGEAKYTNDMPIQRDSLHAVFVLSEKAHANLLKIDASAAESHPGVLKFFSASDVSDEENAWGAILQDEQLFRKDKVTSTGQPIGMIVAETEEAAMRAARLVKVDYSVLEPVLTIDQAITAESFLTQPHSIQTGNVDDVFALPDTVVVEGEMRVGAQEHFYLETNCAQAVPGDGDELTIYASTQNPTKAQKFAAHVCGISSNKVVCRMKRMGGGFGGKETRATNVSSAVALAAHRLHRPVRMNVERDVDMWITGQRHPFLGKYKAAAGPDGKLRALELRLYSNGGWSLDLSQPVLDRALFHSDNVYKIPNVRVTGRVCKTNTGSNTAFRGFGGPQGLIICETWMEHLATALKMQPEELRARNMYELDGDRTFFYMPLERCPIQRLWHELAESSRFGARVEQVAAFNKDNRWRKRGISMLPTKFGISFTATFMNQGGALVHIYVDGTVLVTHGGTEMGQGLHTKMIQVTAQALGIPPKDVEIRETSTDTVPNSSPTAASASSDLYGMAILSACEQLSGRLQPYLDKAGGEFKKAVNMAYFDRCDLSAHGFYKTPGISYDWENPKCEERGTPFRYFTYGGACSEVEIDVLTGDMRILRTDIVMDVGNSLNPTIDVGQIEGAFMQGVGWSTIEEVVWGCDAYPWLPPGACFTRGPGTYKIPSFNDVPVDLRVTLLKDSANPRAIHSSRAIGEPPFFLGSSAFTAARTAIAAARADAGVEGHFTVDMPLTPERIRLACGDKLAERFVKKMSRARPAGFW